MDKWIDFYAVSAVCYRTGCTLQHTICFVVLFVGIATRFANLRWKFHKL